MFVDNEFISKNGVFWNLSRGRFFTRQHGEPIMGYHKCAKNLVTDLTPKTFV